MTSAHKRPERPQQRGVGKLGFALLDSLAAEDDGIVGMTLLELPYQPRLADTRLASQQDERRTAIGGFPQAGLKLRQLPDASDEVSARQSCAHD